MPETETRRAGQVILLHTGTPFLFRHAVEVGENDFQSHKLRSQSYVELAEPCATLVCQRRLWLYNSLELLARRTKVKPKPNDFGMAVATFAM